MGVFRGWWQVTAALVLNAASSASVFTAYSVIAVPLQETFEPSRMVLMMGMTLAIMAAGLLGAPVGAAIDRFSVKLLMLGGTFLLGGGFFLLSLTTSMPQVLVIYLLVLSVGSVLTGPLAASALLARWFSRHRGLAISIAASGSAVGGLFIPPLLQFLIDTFEWRAALQIYGVGLFIITAPIVLLLIVNRPADRNLHPDGDSEPPPVPEGQLQRKAESMLEVMRNRNFWLIALCTGMLFAGPMGLLSNLIPIVVEKGIDPAKGAILLSVYSGANFVGKLGGGALADRLDYRTMLTALMILLSLAMFGYGQSDTYVLFLLASAAVGVAQGSIVPLWSVILGRVYGPENMGRSMGLMGFVMMPFNIAAPPLFGWIYDTTGSYAGALNGYAVLLLGTIAAVTLIRPEKTRLATGTT